MFKGIKSMLFEKEYSLTEVFASCLTVMILATSRSWTNLDIIALIWLVVTPLVIYMQNGIENDTVD